MQPKKSILSRVLSWIVGILFIIGSLGFMTYSILSGIAILIAGLLFLPPIHNLIFSKININIHWFIKVALALSFMFYASNISLQNDKKEFQTNKENIFKEIKEKILNKDYVGATALTSKYKSISENEELKNLHNQAKAALEKDIQEKEAERKRQEKIAEEKAEKLKLEQERIILKKKENELLEKLKATDKKDTNTVLSLYEKLSKGSPNNEVYKVSFKEYKLKSEKEKAEQQAKEQAELEQKRADKLNEKKKEYLAQVNREMDSLKTFSVKKYLESKDSIILGVALFSVWAKIAEEGETFDLNKKESDLLKNFKAKISSIQTRSFPKLRDSYGPAIRQSLWEHDLSAKTNGKGFRNLELVGGAFAANRNIKQFQETISAVVHQLRFKKVKYRWYKGASEFTFYDVKSHNDSKLIIWTEGDRYREVKR